MPEVAKLRRELGLRDVTLFAIACIVGVRWIPAAAHAGPHSIALWLLAAVFFVVPLAIAVGTLTAKYPGSGSLYSWTRGDFGPWHGFLCFWIYWMSIAFWFPSAAMFYMSVAVYTLGPAYAHLADHRGYMVAAALVAIWIALGTNLIGVKIGKWTENLGGAATWVIGGIFLSIAALAWARRGSATVFNIVPHWDLGTLNLGAATIAFAMTGLELVAMMGAEIRNPERTVRRAGWISSAFAALFYSSMTAALLVLLPPAKISERQGLAQGGEVAAQLLGTPWLSPLIAIVILMTGLGQFGGLGSAASRLPFAVGVDKLLPAAFAKVHPRWGTPHVSILTMGGVASLLLIVFQLGDTMGAAYDGLVSMTVIAGFIPYIYVFGSSWKAGHRISALGGWAVSVIALVCSVVPTSEVSSVWLYEFKLAAGTGAVIGSAWLVYRQSKR